jgi:hypothetical protein
MFQFNSLFVVNLIIRTFISAACFLFVCLANDFNGFPDEHMNPMSPSGENAFVTMMLYRFAFYIQCGDSGNLSECFVSWFVAASASDPI